MLRKIVIFAGAALALRAQQPPISNANVETVSAAGGLEASVRSAIAKQSGAAWIGYAVPRLRREGQSCCWNDDWRGCGLEGQRNVMAAAPTGPVKLEGPSHVSVLLRAEQGAVGKIRSFSIDCPLDAGGLPVYWLTDVKPAESVAMLLRYATDTSADERRKRVSEPAVHAIAEHAGSDADSALENLATSGQSDQIRKSALFWLGNSRGRRGYEIVSRAAREDPSDKVREHAVFALTQSREPEAIPAIIRVAKEDKSTHVRSQALFWLGQKASRQSKDAITEAIDRDPDTEVKKKAVFALSQLPKDEGVPMLIQVARTNANPGVRKQAMFWLGQSKDPRALKFFEDVLTK